ncbi:nucleoside hydrolase [Escherichia coli]
MSKAITSSAGNQTPEKTLRNVLRMLTLLNRTDIPVAGGAVKPVNASVDYRGQCARRKRSGIARHYQKPTFTPRNSQR